MLIAGVDEVGRGPLAGPVVAAAVVFKQGYSNPNIKDSKKLSAASRESLVDTIKQDCVSWSIISVGHHRIEIYNIREASKIAMSLAVQRIKADLVLVDGNMQIYTDIPQKTIVSGDNLHVEISAASILAKVWRDNLMKVIDNKFPDYGFARHAGYGTKFHREAIKSHGPCYIHRKSFGGVREYLQKH